MSASSSPLIADAAWEHAATMAPYLNGSPGFGNRNKSSGLSVDAIRASVTCK
jgi:uncharacterized protein involved in outer membrane biogenesis